MNMQNNNELNLPKDKQYTLELVSHDDGQVIKTTHTDSDNFFHDLRKLVEQLSEEQGITVNEGHL